MVLLLVAVRLAVKIRLGSKLRSRSGGRFRQIARLGAGTLDVLDAVEHLLFKIVVFVFIHRLQPLVVLALFFFNLFFLDHARGRAKGARELSRPGLLCERRRRLLFVLMKNCGDVNLFGGTARRHIELCRFFLAVANFWIHGRGRISSFVLGRAAAMRCTLSSSRVGGFAGGRGLRCRQIPVFGNALAGKNNRLIGWRRLAFRRCFGGARWLRLARFAGGAAAIEFGFREAAAPASTAAASKAAAAATIAITLLGASIGLLT